MISALNSIPRTPVAVQGRDGVDSSATRIDSIIFSDGFHPSYGPGRRVFWLIDYQAQLVYEPWGWQQEWYVDIVDIVCTAKDGLPTYQIRDMDIDIVVEGMGPIYRMLDLDEFGLRMQGGVYTPECAAVVLSRTQTFLDAFLHRGVPWPPPQLMPYFSPNHDYSA